jgi:hypothetical protein
MFGGRGDHSLHPVRPCLHRAARAFHRAQFLHALGIHGDPVASRRRIDLARRKGERFEGQAYSYGRAFAHNLDADDQNFVHSVLFGKATQAICILDPSAGGGSIPFEANRLGFSVFANDLNPVAVLIEKATVEYPARHGAKLLYEFKLLAEAFVTRRGGPYCAFSRLNQNGMQSRRTICGLVLFGVPTAMD